MHSRSGACLGAEINRALDERTALKSLPNPNEPLYRLNSLLKQHHQPIPSRTIFRLYRSYNLSRYNGQPIVLPWEVRPPGSLDYGHYPPTIDSLAASFR